MIPELSLTEEQSELVAEYAAGLLVKYQIGHTMGLVPVSVNDLIEEDTPEAAASDIVIEAEPIPDDANENVQDLSADNVEGNAVETISSTIPINEVFGTNGISIDYSGYEFFDVYPEADNGDMVFSMQATPGKELLVVHFNISSNDGSDIECDLLSGNVRAKLSIDGGEKVAAQATILDNDLLNYCGVVNGNGQDGVLVFEVAEDINESLSSLDLTLIGAQGENLYKLL